MQCNNKSQLRSRLSAIALASLTVTTASTGILPRSAQAQVQQPIVQPFQLNAQLINESAAVLQDLTQILFDPTEVVEPPIDIWTDVAIPDVGPAEVPADDQTTPEDVLEHAEVQRFFIRFNDGALRYEPSDGSLQISTQQNVLSYGQDWQVLLIEPGVYAFKQDVWKGFYWKVDTVAKLAYRVTNGSFGEGGGDEEPLDIIVETVGDDENPDWFYLRFDEAYIVRSKEGAFQIASQNNVLSYGLDWEVSEVAPDLFQIKQDYWKSFFWEIDTTQSKAVRVEGGTFGLSYGAQSIEDLDVTVDVVY